MAARVGLAGSVSTIEYDELLRLVGRALPNARAETSRKLAEGEGTLGRVGATGLRLLRPDKLDADAGLSDSERPSAARGDRPRSQRTG